MGELNECEGGVNGREGGGEFNGTGVAGREYGCFGESSLTKRISHERVLASNVRCSCRQGVLQLDRCAHCASIVFQRGRRRGRGVERRPRLAAIVRALQRSSLHRNRNAGGTGSSVTFTGDNSIQPHLGRRRDTRQKTCVQRGRWAQFSE